MGNYGIYGLMASDASGQIEDIRYIGKGVLPARPKSHGSTYKLRQFSHLPVCRWISKLRKTGLDYVWVLIEPCEPESASERERFWIAQWRDWGVKLLNCTDGGEGVPGWKHSRCSIIKNSKAHGGKVFQDQYGNTYETHTEASLKTGVHLSHFSRILNGSLRSSKGYMFWHVGEPAKQLPTKEEKRLKNARGHGMRPFQDEMGRIYTSIAEASDFLGISRPTIRQYLNGRVVQPMLDKAFWYVGDAPKTVLSKTELSRRAAVSHGMKPFRDQHGTSYHTLKEAAQKIGSDPSSVSKVLRGKSAHAKGFVFTFLEIR